MLTDQARQGIFRYFPGVQNGNILANIPTVDRNGNPVKPTAGAPADLTSFNVFATARRHALGCEPHRLRHIRMDQDTAQPHAVAERLHGWRWLEYGRHSLAAPHRKGRIRPTAMATTQIGTNTTSASITISTRRHKASFSGTWERDSAETTQAGHHELARRLQRTGAPRASRDHGIVCIDAVSDDRQ